MWDFKGSSIKENKYWDIGIPEMMASTEKFISVLLVSSSHTF